MSKKTGISHQATTHQGRERKEELVARFLEKVGKSKGIIFTNYKGLTHHQLETLKKAVKKLDAEFVTTKNRLLLRALTEKNISLGDDHVLEGPTATLFAYADTIEPLKHITKMIKEFKLPEIKFGFLEGEILSSGEIMRLSTLPPKPVLQAQLLGQMLSPISGLHRALNWNLVKLAMTLSAIKEKKETN